jgi:hypothetical protein
MRRIASLRLIITIAILFLANTNNLFAQDERVEEKNEAQYGLKAGINFAELWGEDALPESDRKVGYSFGVYASYKISKEWKLQPEVIWSLQGENSKESGRYKISYINIPIMFKWKSKKFYTEFGPQLGLLTINTAKSVPDDLQLDNFETFDFSLNAGLGYEIFEDWSVGVRYVQGVTNIVRGRDLRNSVIYLGISYRIF